MVRKKILVIGPICAEPGGVSVHLKRLVELLKDDFYFTFLDESRNITENVYNIRSRKLLPFIRLFLSADIVNIHSAIGFLRLVYVVTAKFFRKKVVLVIHAWNPNKSLLTILFTKISIKLSDRIVLVNKDITHYLKISNFLELPAFIPPAEEEFLTLPEDVLGKLTQFSGVVMVANAFRVDILNGKDVYGIDSCIDVARKLKRDKISAKIFFVISNITYNVDVLKSYLSIINSESLTDFIEIIPKSLPFISLIKEADLVLRPTITDGDALTIREALFLKTPVIASDVVVRPAGTKLYRFEEENALYKKIFEFIVNKDDNKQLFVGDILSRDGYRDKYEKLYDFSGEK